MDGIIKTEDHVTVQDGELICKWCGGLFEAAKGPVRAQKKGRKKKTIRPFCSRDCYNAWHRSYMKNRLRHNAWLQVRKRAKAAGEKQPGYEEYLAGIESGLYETMEGADYHQRLAYYRIGKRAFAAYLKLINVMESHFKRSGKWPDTKTVIDLYAGLEGECTKDSIRRSVKTRLAKMERFRYVVWESTGTGTGWWRVLGGEIKGRIEAELTKLENEFSPGLRMDEPE